MQDILRPGLRVGTPPILPYSVGQTSHKSKIGFKEEKLNSTFIGDRAIKSHCKSVDLRRPSIHSFSAINLYCYRSLTNIRLEGLKIGNRQISRVGQNM